MAQDGLAARQAFQGSHVCVGFAKSGCSTCAFRMIGLTKLQCRRHAVQLRYNDAAEQGCAWRQCPSTTVANAPYHSPSFGPPAPISGGSCQRIRSRAAFSGNSTLRAPIGRDKRTLRQPPPGQNSIAFEDKGKRPSSQERIVGPRPKNSSRGVSGRNYLAEV